MSEPNKFSPGEVLQASRLNEMLDYARPQYGSVPSYGSHIFGSQNANGSSGPQLESVILVYATEDFDYRTTDSGTVDDIPSGLCDFMRLSRASNIHEEKTGREFYVHDVLAELGNGSPKQSGEVFYAVWNHDSKRWEVLSSAGIRLQAAIVVQCLGRGWHEIELCDWNGRPAFVESLSGSPSGSESCDYNDLEAGADSHCRMPCEFEPCNTLVDGEVPMDPCVSIDVEHTPNYAHTTRQLPMMTGGLIKVIRRFGSPIGTIGSESTSGSEDPWYFDVVDGVWPIKRIPFTTHDTCIDPVTGACTVIQTGHWDILVEGYECEHEEDESCQSSSISESGVPI